MKISELNVLNRTMPLPASVERKESGQKGFSFKGEFSSVNEQNAAQKLAEMGENITRQGALVAKRCDLLELKRYREMIAEFMHEAVRFAFEFKKQSTLDARGRHRMYAVIKRINQKLEELTKEMIAGEGDNLAVMNAIDEIRGLLCDILL